MTPPTRFHSPLADIEQAFRRSTRPPAVLALTGAAIGSDLPSRLLPLDELRRLLLHGATSYGTKDRAIALVLSRARSGEDPWTVGLAGMLMPGLKRVARRLRRIPGVDATEVGAEVVVGFLEAASIMDPDGERLAARMCWEVYRRAARALGVRRRGTQQPVWLTDVLPGSATPSTNPEAVIARAVGAGVITVDDAELIAQTRLEGHRIIELAESLGLPPARLQKRRVRAEARLTDLVRGQVRDRVADLHLSAGSGTVLWCDSDEDEGHAGYQSRPGGRLAGLIASPSEVDSWAALLGGNRGFNRTVAA